MAQDMNEMLGSKPHHPERGSHTARAQSSSLEIARDILLKPLQTVSGIVERRQTLAILSNVLIEAGNGVLSLTATDLEIQVTATHTGIDPEVTFAVTVSAKKLVDILRALPDQAVVSLERSDSRLLVRAGRSRFQLQTLPPGDFPRLPAEQVPIAGIPMPQKALLGLLRLTHYAMAQQDIRYYLNGMLFVVEENELKLVATDGHRLAMATRELPVAAPSRSEIILPRKAVLELNRMLSDDESPCQVSLLENQVRFEVPGITLVTKVIDGKFPDYNRVVPANYGRHMEVPRSVLQMALQRAAILSNEKYRGVRWILSSGSLRILCNNTEQEEAEEELEVSYEGEAIDIGFNITYILEALASVEQDGVRCSFGDASTSMLITLPGREDFKYVVMPMRI